jgi:hypothetical protein
MMHMQIPSGRHVMNLRQIAPLYEVVAPELYEGTESVVADLCTQSLIAALGNHEGAPILMATSDCSTRSVARVSWAPLREVSA